MSLLMIDMDYFKSVNDRFGHPVGDRVLSEFALKLSTHVRAMDVACRVGGEEFVVLMPGTGLDPANQIAERIRIYLAGVTYNVGNEQDALTVTVSIGVATTSGPDDTADALLSRADQGLYDAKLLGRNRVVARAA